MPNPRDVLGTLGDLQGRFATYAHRAAPGFFGGRTEVASPVSASARGLATPATRPPDTGGGGGFGGVPAALLAAQSDPTLVTTATDTVPVYSTPAYGGGGDDFFAEQFSGSDIVGITGTEAGIYQISASCRFPSSTAGNYRELRIQADDGFGWFDIAGSDPPPTGASRSTWVTATGQAGSIAAIDFRIWLRHDAGSDLYVGDVRMSVLYLGA